MCSEAQNRSFSLPMEKELFWDIVVKNILEYFAKRWLLDFRIFLFKGRKLQGMVAQMKFLHLLHIFILFFFFPSIDVNSSIKPVATLSQEKNLPSNLYITKFLALSYKRLLAACTSPGVCVGVAAFNSGTSWVWFVITCGSSNQNIGFSLGIQSARVCSPGPTPHEVGAVMEGVSFLKCLPFLKYLSFLTASFFRF